jgi:4-alpha-glucanotransferase
MDEALLRLALAAGIEAEYWDGLGTRRELTDDTARALLGSLGLDPQGDCAMQERALGMAAWSRPLPDVLVVEDAAAIEFESGLPVASVGSQVSWRLECESGTRLTGEAAIERIGATQTRAADRTELAHCRVRLEFAPGNAPGLGYHRLHLPSLDAATVLIVTPRQCHLPEHLADGGRCWGIAVQLYALRSARNWGIGDFTDLARLAGHAGHAGAALIGLNPLHARHLARADEASPYAPSSRRMLDPVYLDVEAIDEFAHCPEAQAMVGEPGFKAALEAARAAPLVDYAAVTALKLRVLAALHRQFRTAAGEAAAARRLACTAFVRDEGAALQRFALFQALQLWMLERDGSLPGWHDWAAEWRDPDSPALAAFCVAEEERIDFQYYLQWQAALQLDSAGAAARNAGMRIGLYRDLAVGAADDGAECWGEPQLIAPRASVGAPPDLLNREGQDWGLPPWNPRALAQAAYRPFTSLLAANMRAAGALRIDHVMALKRLFWIPAGQRGASGAYVRNDFAALAGIVALESRRNRCMVIGEDLGSVPDGFRESLAGRGFLSYRVLIFERHWNGDGSFKRPWEYPAQALATVATHDMPTIAEYWRGGDIGRRDALGMFPAPQLRDDEAARRAAERARLLELLSELGLRPAEAALTDQGSAGVEVARGLHAAIARSHAMLAIVQLDDIEGETEPANIPGTHREYPNWRRKLSRDLEQIVAAPRFAALARAMRDAGRA